MMSVNRWAALWLIFIGYLFFGAFIFYTTERRYEEERHVEENFDKLQLRDILLKYYSGTSSRVHQLLVTRLREHCSAANRNISDQMFSTGSGNYFSLTSEEPIEEEIEEEFQWTFYNSFFFALTTLSTIGYGNLHPTSSLGRILVIFYSLLGIPLNGIVLTQLGEFFASTFLRVHERYKGKRFETRFVLIVDIIMYLIPGVLVFIFLPSGLFVYFEGWTFDESIYFAFVTLTTIGYGDYVAGQTTRDKRWFGVYKVVLILWIMFGLGYLVMILGFISRAMRCKHMARLEQKLAQNLKQTHSKIWNGFTKDVTNMRRMLNEVYLLKFKPVYRDKGGMYYICSRKRSQSAPNLREWPTAEKIVHDFNDETSSSDIDNDEETRLQFEKYRMNRRKGLSQNILKQNMLRVRSEGDLSKIDRVATFGTAGTVQQNELLARVVDVLGTTYGIESCSASEDEYEPARKMSRYERELQGISGFSNAEILSSEWQGNKSQEFEPELLRRSCSIPFEEKRPIYPEQWTWPGSAIIQNTATIKINNGVTGADRNRLTTSNEEKRASLQLPGVNRLRRMSAAALNFITNKRFSGNKEPQELQSTLENGVKKRRSGKSNFLSVKTEQKPRYSLCDTEYETMCDYINYLTQTEAKQANIVNLLKNQIDILGSSNDNFSPVLEKTSIGDFIRILSSMRNISQADTHLLQCDSNKYSGNSALFSLFQRERQYPEHSKTLLNQHLVSPKLPKKLDRRRYSSFSPQNYSTINSVHSLSKGEDRGSSTLQIRYATKKTSSNPSLSIPQIRRCLQTQFNHESRQLTTTQMTVPTIMITNTSGGINSNSSIANSQNRRRHIHRFSIRPASVSRQNSQSSSVKSLNQREEALSPNSDETRRSKLEDLQSVVIK